MRLLEDNLDAVARRYERRLEGLEGTLDPNVVARKGLEGTSIGRVGSNVVVGRVGSGRCC